MLRGGGDFCSRTSDDAEGAVMRIWAAKWSHRASHQLEGRDEKLSFVSTPPLYFFPEKDVYVTATGKRVEVVTWGWDGRGYQDKRR